MVFPSIKLREDALPAGSRMNATYNQAQVEMS